MDDASIEHIRQNLLHALIRDFAVAHLRHRRLRFKKAHHFGLAGKAPARIAFKSFLYDGGQRLIANKDFPAA
ncbi:MAG: hypothetical protein E6R12_05060 [Sphingomonadales bacterium]|nr:MAG: hypothetical protein E6R12_05060 [Sphingomonadales bacterium]